MTSGPGTREIVVADAALGARVVADAIVEALHQRSNPVIGLATGSSPEPAYQELLRRHAAELLPVAAAWWVLVDEYVGLPAGHPQRYRQVADDMLLRALGVSGDRVLVPDVDRVDLLQACQDFEDRLESLGGVDLQILGIGTNGHLGFNEPGTPFDQRTHVVHLHERTRLDNSRFFDDATTVPASAVTEGLATLLDAGRLVVVASGDAKAPAVEAAVVGPLSTQCPASILRRHQNVLLVLDHAARGDWDVPDGWISRQPSERGGARVLPAP